MKKESHSFHFKQFSVRHDRCTMKVGTDAVLIGAWSSVESAVRILDIGTGSGVIALMLAQRTSKQTMIDAIEIEREDALQATKNVLRSPWPDKIQVINSSLNNFSITGKYDLIVSNPPFFLNSSPAPGEKRNRARHATQLSHHDLLLAAHAWLGEPGKFSVILPTEEGAIFQNDANAIGLYCHRRTAFYSRKEKPQERWLMEFGKAPVTKSAETKLVLYEAEQLWSADYQKLVGDFYL